MKIAVIILAAALSASLPQSGTAATPTSVQAGLKELDAALIAAGPQMLTYKRLFPDKYWSMLAKLGIAREGGASFTDAANIGRSETENFMKENYKNIADAPKEALIDYLHALGDAVDYLKSHDVARCAAFATGAVDRTGLPPPTPQTLHNTFALYTTALIAARKGLDTPAHRTYWQPPREAILHLLNIMLSNGLTYDQAGMFDDNNLLTSASTEDQCNIAVLTYRAARLLPSDEAVAWLAFLIGSSH